MASEHETRNPKRTPKVAAIVPAAGAGRRVGGRTSKLFLRVGGQPLLAQTLRALQASPHVGWILVVTRAEDRARVAALIRRARLSKAQVVSPGGPSRAASVARGFAAAPPQARWVLVHDAARPCLTEALIARAVRAARRRGAVACGLPAHLTVKAADETGMVRLTLDRERLWFVQTPQVFRREWFAQALARAGLSPSLPTALAGQAGGDGRQAEHRLDHFPDDVSLLEEAGFPVSLVPGDPWNLKVTTPEDLALAETILQRRKRGQERSMVQ